MIWLLLRPHHSKTYLGTTPFPSHRQGGCIKLIILFWVPFTRVSRGRSESVLCAWKALCQERFVPAALVFHRRPGSDPTPSRRMLALGGPFVGRKTLKSASHWLYLGLNSRGYCRYYFCLAWPRLATYPAVIFRAGWPPRTIRNRTRRPLWLTFYPPMTNGL